MNIRNISDISKVTRIAFNQYMSMRKKRVVYGPLILYPEFRNEIL